MRRFTYLCLMFIRRVKKQRSKESGIFYQYQLVQSVRIEGKPRQKIILYLGSDPFLADRESRANVLAILKAKIFDQPDLYSSEVPEKLVKIALAYYEKYRIRYGLDEEKYDDNKSDTDNNENNVILKKVSIPPLPGKADYHKVDIKSLELTDVKSFGAEHLCLQILERLGLEEQLKELGVKDVRRAIMAISAKAIFSSSEYKTAQILNLSADKAGMNSELAALCGETGSVNHKALYAITDELYEHKKDIDRFLYNLISNIFSLENKLVIFDISNTYFEGTKVRSKLSKFGRSKEKRSDCRLVVFTGVVNAEGFIRHSRIYEGNKSDSGTLADMIDDLEKNNESRTEKQTVVIDAGIATEENLKLIKERGHDYVCVSRKRLKDYPISEDSEKVYELTNREKEKVKLSVFKPEDHDDCWMYIQSDNKRKKEQSIDCKLSQRYEEGLETIRDALSTKRGTKRTEKVWERIGRLKQKYSRASSRYTLKVKESKGKATDITWSKKTDPIKKDKSEGVYFLRTSYTNPKEKELWKIYNTIREVEATFRCLKTDLKIRPVYHQKDERIEAHLYLTILAYQLVNTIRYILKQSGVHYDWQNIVRIMSTQTIQTVVLPTDKKRIHLRKPSKPIKEAQEIYKITKCKNTQKPVRKYVVYH